MNKQYTIRFQSSPEAWRNVYWNEDIPKYIQEGEFTTEDKHLYGLLYNLDRRFVQLWDKVSDEKGVSNVLAEVVSGLLENMNTRKGGE